MGDPHSSSYLPTSSNQFYAWWHFSDGPERRENISTVIQGASHIHYLCLGFRGRQPVSAHGCHSEEAAKWCGCCNSAKDQWSRGYVPRATGNSFSLRKGTTASLLTAQGRKDTDLYCPRQVISRGMSRQGYS